MAVTEPRLTPDPGNARPDLDRQKSLWARMWEHRALYVAIWPFYILFAVFGLFPIGFSLYSPRPCVFNSSQISAVCLDCHTTAL